MIGADVPLGVQGRSLLPLLVGTPFPAEEFKSIYCEVGTGGIPYGANERPDLDFPYEGPQFNELNTVTQSGSLRMVRMGQWKLLFDVMGQGELYNLEKDPGELNNVFADDEYLEVRRATSDELMRWMIRTQDDLPLGGLVPKRAPRNWYIS